MANTPKDPRKKPVQKPESELYGTSNGMRIRTLILVAAFLIFGFGLLIISCMCCRSATTRVTA